jgi:NAD-dependent deacetylase
VNDPIAALAAHVARARKIVALSGAGLSAESGVPTFRGAGGLWRTHNAMALATPEAFERDPALVWEFYNERRARVLACAPNPAHLALVELERRAPAFVHITQNVDGLSQRAGGRNIIELHGSLFATRCAQCGADHPHHDGVLAFPSHCHRCGGLLRPGVVWFGEPVERIGEAAQALAGCDVYLVVGTSNLVEPAASLAAIAKRGGALVAEFNLDPTPLTPAADFFLPGPVGQTLPAVVAAAFP